ncbi:hypothetical protein QBC37DRAFT_464152 [Rhypophila decipiens]|uniref:Zn(2)-C6 fungal-type domain-containing protein n=1 Tax=Rhypophila decipiens TaxID=261697 RepID=A0AAN7B9P8_9PEZI|nr:hypothetical protein QBC37DRAFT_464152 [Rhypophila decipiens]
MSSSSQGSSGSGKGKRVVSGAGNTCTNCKKNKVKCVRPPSGADGVILPCNACAQAPHDCIPCPKDARTNRDTHTMALKKKEEMEITVADLLRLFALLLQIGQGMFNQYPEIPQQLQRSLLWENGWASVKEKNQILLPISATANAHLPGLRTEGELYDFRGKAQEICQLVAGVAFPLSQGNRNSGTKLAEVRDWLRAASTKIGELIRVWALLLLGLLQMGTKRPRDEIGCLKDWLVCWRFDDLFTTNDMGPGSVSPWSPTNLWAIEDDLKSLRVVGPLEDIEKEFVREYMEHICHGIQGLKVGNDGKIAEAPAGKKQGKKRAKADVAAGGPATHPTVYQPAATVDTAISVDRPGDTDETAIVIDDMEVLESGQPAGQEAFVDMSGGLWVDASDPAAVYPYEQSATAPTNDTSNTSNNTNNRQAAALATNPYLVERPAQHLQVPETSDRRRGQVLGGRVEKRQSKKKGRPQELPQQYHPLQSFGYTAADAVVPSFGATYPATSFPVGTYQQQSPALGTLTHFQGQQQNYLQGQQHLLPQPSQRQQQQQQQQQQQWLPQQLSVGLPAGVEMRSVPQQMGMPQQMFVPQQLGQGVPQRMHMPQQQMAITQQQMAMPQQMAMLQQMAMP